MPKRFTDSDKWKDKWFRSLRPEFKLAYLYLLDNCDCAGVVELDSELACFQIGASIDWEQFLELCSERVELLNCGKLWLKKFVCFQYGELSEACKPHKAVFASLAKYGLLERVAKGYPKGIDTLQEKEKEKDSDLIIPEWLKKPWERWQLHLLQKCGQRMQSIQAQQVIYELASRKESDAVLDIDESIRWGSKNIRNHEEYGSRKNSATTSPTKLLTRRSVNAPGA